MQFLLGVEKIHGSYMMTLREVLLDLLKAFLEHFHESKMQALSATLDSEPWKQADVSAERQRALDGLSNGLVLAPGSASALTADAPQAKVAVVDGRKYHVVWSCLLLLEL